MGLAGESPQRGVLSSGWVCAGQCCIQSLVVGAGGCSRAQVSPSTGIQPAGWGTDPALGMRVQGAKGQKDIERTGRKFQQVSCQRDAPEKQRMKGNEK